MLRDISFATALMFSAAIFSSSPAVAHHGSGGQFDTASSMQVTGVVTKIKFVNPHSYVYFDVTTEDGTVNAWRCELRSGSIHKRSGWTKEMFAPGTKITIDGAPARREEFGCMTRVITFEDGTKINRNDKLDSAGKTIPQPRVLTVDGKPNFAGNWLAVRGERPARGGGMGGPPGGGMGGPPGGGMGGPGSGDTSAPLSLSTRYKMTKANEAASQNFMRDENPRFHCQATNLFHDWSFDQHVNEVKVEEDIISMRYGFMDIVRYIHVGMKSHPAEIVPSRAGHSIAHWDGDVLVVDTVGFEEGYLEAGPFSVAKHSDELHVKERFSMSEDGTKLSRTYELEDSKFLSKTYKGEDSVNYTDSPFDPYECEDLTEEVVSGF